MHITQAEIDALILEDLPAQDETSRAIGLPDRPGVLAYTARQPGVLCGVALCARLGQALGLQAEALLPDGAAVTAGTAVLRLHGGAHALHAAWKPGMNLLEYLSGIATATAAMVAAARAVRPGTQVAATRKAFPGARRLQQHAVRCGGGIVHRAGLSETVLVFAQHRAFLPGVDLATLVARARQASPEKRVLVEADTDEDALAAAVAGADGVQIDKMRPDPLGRLVARLREKHPGLLIGAAGGVRVDNAAAYAATGVDVLVTSSFYTAAPLDFGARMLPSDADGHAG